MFTIVVAFLILLLIAGSLRQLLTSLEVEHRTFSGQIFFALLLLYTIIMVGFGIIYATLSYQGLIIFAQSPGVFPYSWTKEVARGVYFSGVTLFTVGYGDLMPIGWGRLVAVFEALIGYTLPAAIVAKVWQNSRDS
ncbi:potassium channel family protein [Halobacillus amylolyticus]|uniref:Potassium channel family protein n=1 Tax=Halobacillus amylolyticus TaxID=2932259 RepID=A0ABY4HFK8_9BACI|nr:potassium channel family protein [Halobacillus amylolyticus]UOR13321.1 potassium channel family protein [Halobacillus amylolyticus]